MFLNSEISEMSRKPEHGGNQTDLTQTEQKVALVLPSLVLSIALGLSLAAPIAAGSLASAIPCGK